jgi:hypothetical protein
MAEIPAHLATDVERGIAPPRRSAWPGLSGGQSVLGAILVVLKWVLLVALAIFILGPLIV